MQSISIFGLGYVGTVTAACFASRGHKVIGVDPTVWKVERVLAGMSPIVEGGVPELIATAAAAGLISATQDAAEAISESNISFISVGTPSQRNGKLDLSHIHDVCHGIGEALRTKNTFHWIVLRSTVLPSTTQEVVIPALERASGKKEGKDFLVCFNPEFLREGTAVSDFFSPPFTIVGTDNPKLAAPIVELYRFLPAEIYETGIPAAEMVKYSCNSFHALKIAFANEVGSICNALGVDPKVVANLLKADTKLNISTAYLTPGFAFGGSCLPKDLRALMYRVRELGLRLPLLESVLPSNTEHIDRAAEAIFGLGKRRVSILGLSFKPGTDDLRDSPMVHLVKKLIGEGYEVQVWDENVSLGRLIGSNKQFIHEYIPHIGVLLRKDLQEVVEHGEVIVTATNSLSREQLGALLQEGQYLMDVMNLDQPVLTSETFAAGLKNRG